MRPPYNSRNPCPKCLHGEAGTKYQESSWGPPYMVRTCTRCGAVWYEEPLDAPEDPEPKD